MKIVKFNNIYVKTSDVINEKAKNIWFFHGLGDAGSFDNAFEYLNTEKVNIFIIDFPGFGKAEKSSSSTLGELANMVATAIISLNSRQGSIYIVGHSAGVVLGNMVCANLLLSGKVHLETYLNVEGILVEDLTRSSSKSIAYSDPRDFQNYMVDSLSLSSSKIFREYADKIKTVDPDALYFWATQVYELTCHGYSGKKYIELVCEKVYIGGEKSPLLNDREFILNSKTPLEIIKDATHWPMLENPYEFYTLVSKLVGCDCNLPSIG
ncbi:MAG: hypothetical protein K0R48_901 [Gammaproteobacteria bacterium]|jgi:pimeloyl-ACP methyl ester carboxylesterase|nr:hypothetical protein [Gammaproteobacteria bacterium]